MSGRKPQLSQLARALDKLTWCDVKCMAVQLGMPYSKLEQIQEGRSALKDQILNAMDTWLNSDKSASWQKLVNALKAINKTVLAEDLEKEYCSAIGVPPATVPSTKPAAPNNKGLLNPYLLSSIQSTICQCVCMCSAPPKPNLMCTYVCNDEWSDIKKMLWICILHGQFNSAW